MDTITKAQMAAARDRYVAAWPDGDPQDLLMMQSYCKQMAPQRYVTQGAPSDTHTRYLVKWTPAEDEIVKREYPKGTPIHEIHKLLPGRTRHSIYAHATLSLKLRRPEPKTEREKKVREAARKGSRVLKECAFYWWYVPPHLKPQIEQISADPSLDRDAKIRKQKALGMTKSELANFYGLTPSSISNALKKGQDGQGTQA